MGIQKNFVVKNGLEVADTLLVAENNKVGINTSSAEYSLDINGSLGISSAFYVPKENPLVKTTVGILSDSNFGSITGINTSLIRINDYISGNFIQNNTQIISIGNNVVSISKNHTNISGITNETISILRYKTSGEDGDFLLSRGEGKSPIWATKLDIEVSYAKTSFDVIGGIASVSQLYVNPGISTVEDLHVNGNFQVSGISTFLDSTSVDSTLDVTGATTLDSTLDVTGATTLNSTLDVDGSTNLNDKTTITGNSDSLLNIDHDGSGNALQINNYKFSVKTGSFNASSGVSTVVDSYSLLNDEYDTMEYTLNIINGDNIQAQKVLVLQNTTNVYCSEYGVIFNNKPIVSIGVSIVNFSYELKLTPESGISGLTTYKFIRGGIV